MSYKIINYPPNIKKVFFFLFYFIFYFIVYAIFFIYTLFFLFTNKQMFV